MRDLYMSCYLDSATGYGQQNSQFVSGFQDAGINVRVFPTGLMESTEAPLAQDIQRAITIDSHAFPEFYVQPPSGKPDIRTPSRVWFAVWEATRLDPLWVGRMNRCKAIVTSSDWNASCFSASGVTVPIYKVPLYAPPEYSYSSPLGASMFVFGCSGHLGAQSARKNLPAVIQAFQRAFPKTLDVELRIKTALHDFVPPSDDPRIRHEAGHRSAAGMQAWYKELDVFVHPSRAEGWGFQPLQAMAAGRPVIACKFGGVAEYFDGSVGLETRYTYMPAEGMYSSFGHWADPDVDSLAENMLYAYNNQALMRQKGITASHHATNFSVGRTMTGLITVLERHGIIV